MTAPALAYSTSESADSWRTSQSVTTAQAVTVVHVAPQGIPRVIGTVELLGENFLVDEEGGQIYLSHPQWSLAGMGTTVANAIADLLGEARALADVMEQEDTSALSPQAQRLREYVLNFR